MGATGTGKSTFINTASGSKLCVGETLRSCTDKIETSLPFVLNDQHVTLIDTPSFDNTSRSDTEVLKLISAFLSETYKTGQHLNGIIYMHRITDIRMGGIATRNFRMFRKLCGEETLKNVVIVANGWEEVQPDVAERRERELMMDERFFKPVLDMGAQMVRHDNTPQTAHAILSHLIRREPIPLCIQSELGEGKSFEEDHAGVELNTELVELMKTHGEEREELQKEFEGEFASLLRTSSI
ncbi:hypothetical protein PQX77_013252 [Marasmius sp. AFHP31]|nr:hypothetical protein PQX77_013252 [Marasmius sp. AFHP31]